MRLCLMWLFRFTHASSKRSQLQPTMQVTQRKPVTLEENRKFCNRCSYVSLLLRPQDTKALKEHLLKRQQRIQQHQQKRLGISLEHASQDSIASSPCPTPSALSSSDEPSYPLLADGTTAESRTQPSDVRWKRFLHLRRVLSEHTAFNQGNAQPAPITSIAPSK